MAAMMQIYTFSKNSPDYDVRPTEDITGLL